MGLHVRPVGPLSERTYWLRRALLLVPVLLVLLLVRSCADGGDAPDDQLAATRVPAVVPPSAVPLPTVPPSPDVGAPPTTDPTTTEPLTTAPVPAPGEPAPVTACVPDALQLVASTDARSYPTSASPRLTLTVRNTGPAACAAPLGQSAVELEVTSGPDRVWSSDDCDPGGAADPVVLAPGEAQALAVTWSGTRSAPGCPGDREQATAGTYRLVGRAGGLASAPAVFVLT